MIKHTYASYKNASSQKKNFLNTMAKYVKQYSCEVIKTLKGKNG